MSEDDDRLPPKLDNTHTKEDDVPSLSHDTHAKEDDRVTQSSGDINPGNNSKDLLGLGSREVPSRDEDQLPIRYRDSPYGGGEILIPSQSRGTRSKDDNRYPLHLRDTLSNEGDDRRISQHPETLSKNEDGFTRHYRDTHSKEDGRLTPGPVKSSSGKDYSINPRLLGTPTNEDRVLEPGQLFKRDEMMDGGHLFNEVRIIINNK